MQTIYPKSHNLDLLRILYIVKACFNFLGVLLFVAYAGFGAFFFNFLESMPSANQSEGVPPEISWIFILIGLVGGLICLVLAIVTWIAAQKIHKRTSYNYVFAIGIVNCFTGILGIALGVLTFVELSKPHVKALFEPQADSKIGF